MKHVHADLMAEYAKDAQETDKPWERWEHMSEINGCSWSALCTHPKWYAHWDYRHIDPYRKFREAQERGETVWRKCYDGRWWTQHQIGEYPREWTFSGPVSDFSLTNPTKPKTKEAFNGKSFYLKDTGVMWVGTINGQDVSIHAPNATGMELFNAILEEDDVESVMKPCKYQYGTVYNLETSDAISKPKTKKMWRWFIEYMSDDRDIRFKSDYMTQEEFEDLGIMATRDDSTAIEVEA